MHRISREELNAILHQLDQAIRNHEEWFESLNRQMVCHIPFDLRNIRDDAYRECQFGQWLYQYANPHLQEHPAFDVIEREHRRMHQSVAKMLKSIGETGSTRPEDRFSISMQHLRLEITTLKRELETAYYNLDSLTGANSRIGMLTHLREQMELVNRGAQQFTIAMLDLDHFKQVNDTYGHMVGDRALVAVSRLILDNIRTNDRLYRFGGEEFLLSLTHTDALEAMPLIERLRENIERLPISLETGAALHVTVSIGIVDISSGLPVEDAIQRADLALYVAKNVGRNCTQLWHPDMAEKDSLPR